MLRHLLRRASVLHIRTPQPPLPKTTLRHQESQVQVTPLPKGARRKGEEKQVGKATWAVRQAVGQIKNPPLHLIMEPWCVKPAFVCTIYIDMSLDLVL